MISQCRKKNDGVIFYMIETDTVYYDPKTNRFLYVERLHKDGYMTHSLCRFYSDSKTCISREVFSEDYILDCIKADPIDKCPYATFDGNAIKTME